MNIDILC